MKKSEIKIPAIYISLLSAFILIVALILKKETQGQSELYGLIYTLSFFLAHNIYSIIFGILLILPLPLLLISMFKRRKDLIVGYSISTIISLVLVLSISIS